ncbi:hypothetical protein MTX20_34545 [Bradyrhizobium sp. ISRA435]|nr:hypothetical protein MTX20_34545 [Bradyrhizobium sp. ISRA435]
MNEILNRSPIEVDASRNEGLGPVLLIYLHVAACFVSMAHVVQYYAPLMRLTVATSDKLWLAALNVAPFALLSILFAVCRFSFGYLVGFYFFTMLMGYLWLLPLSTFSYDHLVAYASAFTSGLAFLFPRHAGVDTGQTEVRFVGGRLSKVADLHIGVRRRDCWSRRALQCEAGRDLRNLQFPQPARISGLALVRAWSHLERPAAVRLCLFRRRRRQVAGRPVPAAAVHILSDHPEQAFLFAPVWLILLAVASRGFTARTAVTLSLLVPILFGIVLARLFDLNAISYQQFIAYFSLVNFRMIALTSSALDFYNDFFAHHDLTWFCQVNVLKSFIDCPYREPLAIVMQNAYNVGNFNASLFATEGIASVGVILAPLAAFICGLVVAVGNSASSGLPSRFVLLSAGVLPQIFLNVSLTVTFVTNGAALLFILWYMTPRTLFGKKA